VQFEKLEIHTVFLRFSNFHSRQNLSLITLADFIIGYLAHAELLYIKKDDFASIISKIF